MMKLYILKRFKMQEITDKIFEDLRSSAVKVRSDYPDTYGYRTKQTDIVNSITNEYDNRIKFVWMMDPNNQRKLLDLVTEETKEFLYNRYWDFSYL